uniref:Uncharacterized protein n=1 Tax=Meloidogyne incognita TaxID=6306 RepID=A0A914M759_MELIC
MHCLVARPGFGLISEVCPLHTVGCRIRIEKDAVSFYEYSRLYDRNQFVCVLKGEFGEQKGSGCTRKRSGHIRCWCFGRSNCNTPENSKLLYLTFIGGDEEKFKKAVESVDFEDLNNEGEEEEKFLKNKNRDEINITTTTLSSAVIKEELINENIKMLNDDKEKEEGKILKLENVLYEASDIKKAMGAKTVHLSEQFVDNSFTKSTQKLTTLINTIPTNTQKTATTTQKTIPTLTTTPKLTEKPFLHPSTVKSIYDSQNRVHVIHVSGRDRYDNLPVEQLLGSPALRRIMEEEREKLKNKIEDNSAEEEEEEEGEEEEGKDNLDEDEELEEDWEFEKNNNGEEEEEEEEEDLFKRTINNKTKITERRSSSLSNTKISKNSPKNLLKTRMEQRQRSSSSNNNKISSLEEDKESEEEEELKDLTEEYFDSAFFSPSKTSGFKGSFGERVFIKF